MLVCASLAILVVRWGESYNLLVSTMWLFLRYKEDFRLLNSCAAKLSKRNSSRKFSCIPESYYFCENIILGRGNVWTDNVLLIIRWQFTRSIFKVAV